MKKYILIAIVFLASVGIVSAQAKSYFWSAKPDIGLGEVQVYKVASKYATCFVSVTNPSGGLHTSISCVPITEN
jgi:hypothetical protein